MGFRATDQKAEGQILGPMSGSPVGVMEGKLWPLLHTHPWLSLPGNLFQRELGLFGGLRWRRTVFSGLHTKAQGLESQPSLALPQGFPVPHALSPLSPLPH